MPIKVYRDEETGCGYLAKVPYYTVDSVDKEMEEMKEMKEMEEMKADLEWAARKLASVRADFGNAPFTTDDMERIIRIIGPKAFAEASKPSPKGEGVWS
jgi:hypothetical protein